MAGSSLWGPEDPGIFLLLQPSDQESKVKISDISLRILENFIEKNVGAYKKITRLRSGDLLILTAKSSQAAKSGREFSIALNGSELRVKLVLQEKLNQIKGTVFSKRLMQENVEDVKELLKKHGVVDVHRISKKVDGKEEATPIHILTFNKPDLPSKITIVHETLTVRKYYPRPMRCFKCQKFNHTTKHCAAEVEICATCSKEGPHGLCGDVICFNCNQEEDLKSKANSHRTGDKQCPAWLREVKIKEIQTDERVGYMQAKGIFKKRAGIAQANADRRTSAEVVQNAVLDELNKLKQEVSLLRRDLDDKDREIRRYKATLAELTKPLNMVAIDENKDEMEHEDVEKGESTSTSVDISEADAAITESKKRKAEEGKEGAVKKVIPSLDMILDDEAFIVDETTMKHLSRNDKKKVEGVKRKHQDKRGFIIFDPVRKEASFHPEENL